MKNMIYTVVIHNNEPDCAPWVSSFSTWERAQEFMRKARERLEAYGVTDVTVESDSMELDSDEYLDWLDEEYGPDEDAN